MIEHLTAKQQRMVRLYRRFVDVSPGRYVNTAVQYSTVH